MGRYQDALNYIFGYVNYEKLPRFEYNTATLNLSRMQELLERLDHPERRFQCVHIAGTKGKGSTSAMVEAVLRAAGYRVGLFTSPHLHAFRERIRADGDLITKRDLLAVLARCQPAIEATSGITAFEVMTALAFTYFAEQRIDWAVLEVGLGGRLDATNIVHPAVCAITSLSYDHMDLLGHTLAQIAREKAGIIKPNTPVICAPQEAEALAVIQSVAAEKAARLVQVGRDWTVSGGSASLAGQTLTMRRASDGLTLNELHIGLLGRHQWNNAAIAVAMLAELNAQGVVISEAALRQGLAAARWPGRFEVLNERPVIVLDSAHNADSAQKLRAALTEWFPGACADRSTDHARRTALIFGASSDKDISGILETFLDVAGHGGPPCVDQVFVTRSGHPRSTAPAVLSGQVHSLSPDMPLEVAQDVASALAQALAWAGPDDVICVTGSIFIVAQARRAWAALHPQAFPPDDWVFQDETAGSVVSDDEEIS